MGAVPKRRISTGRQGRRRSAIKVSLPNLSPCPSCGQPRLSHTACPSCGQYKGEQAAKQKTEKKSAKGQSASGGKKEK